jgi:hypothetical protein
MQWGYPKTISSANIMRALFMRAENDEFNYPSIGEKYRANTKKRKLKLTPNNNQNEIEYLQELVILMMKADSRRGAIDNEDVALSGLVRVLPTLNVHSTNARALKLRKDMHGRQSMCKCCAGR